MNHQYKARFFLPLLLFIILVSVPLLWISLEENVSVVSRIENRSLIAFPSLTFRDFKTAVKRILQGRLEEANQLFFGQFLDRSFQQNIEKAASDQFPFRLDLINITKGVDREVIYLAYSFLSDPVIPADRATGFFVMRDESLLIMGPVRFNQDTRAIIDERIENYAALIEKYPEINFYVYNIQLLQASEYYPMNQYFSDADHGQGLEYFENNIPDSLFMGKMTLSSMEDYFYHFYRTDHHWNIYGILRGYNEIHDLLARNYTDITPALIPVRYVTFPDIQFAGSLARKSFYFLSEEFEVAEFDFPPYVIMEDGKEINQNHFDTYLRGDYQTTPYLNQYSMFYGNDKALLEYISENGSKRNLLIIGSSFANPLEPLLTSHYHHTYSVDMRHYTDFSFSQFISEHPVDDVLILGDNPVSFSSNKWIINP